MFSGVGCPPRPIRPVLASHNTATSHRMSLAPVACATIRPRRVSRGRLWRWSDGCFFSVVCWCGCWRVGRGMSRAMRVPFSRPPQRQKKRNQPLPTRRAFWGIAREVSPYSSLQGRCPKRRGAAIASLESLGSKGSSAAVRGRGGGWQTATHRGRFVIIGSMNTNSGKKHKLGVNVIFYAFNQYYHRHYEQ